VRLIVVGFLLEAVYIVGFVRPYNLVTWLPSPAQDLGTLTGASLESAAAYLASVGVLIVGGCLAYREACRLPARLASSIAFGFAGLFAATLVWIYPIDALDVFDYAMHGRMLAVLGANPYVDLPAWFPDDSFLPSVGWKTYPSVYGPLWTYLEGAIGWLSRDNLLEAVLLFKVVAALSSLACSWTAYKVAQSWKPQLAPGAIVLVGWNPLVVLMAGSGHNDVLMMALFVTGVWLLARNRPAAGLWLAGISTLIKVATAPLLLVLIVAQVVHVRRAGDSICRKVVFPLAAVVLVSAALYMPLWAGLDHAGPLLLAGLFSQSPLGLLRELWVPNLGEEAASDAATRLGGALLVVIVAIAMYRAHRSQRLVVEAVQDASFWIVFVALGWWQPWYAVWFICLAALDERPWGRGLSWIAALAGLVALWDRFYLTQHWRLPDALSHELHTVLLVFLPPIAWACVAPHVQNGARLFGAYAVDHLGVADCSWRDSVIRSAVSAGGSSSVTTGRPAPG
jgi:Glycosyltransferase family 87